MTLHMIDEVITNWTTEAGGDVCVQLEAGGYVDELSFSFT